MHKKTDANLLIRGVLYNYHRCVSQELWGFQQAEEK